MTDDTRKTVERKLRTATASGYYKDEDKPRSKDADKVCPLCDADLGVNGFDPISLDMHFLIRGELRKFSVHHLECPKCEGQFLTSRQAYHLGGIIRSFGLSFPRREDNS